MTVLTEDEVRAIRERSDAATPGPWLEDGSYVLSPHMQHYRGRVIGRRCIAHDIDVDEDVTFIVAARTDVPALVESHEEMRREHDEATRRGDALAKDAGRAVSDLFSAEAEREELRRERDEWRATAESLRVQESRISGTLCDCSDIIVDPLPDGVAALAKSRDEARRERDEWRTLAKSIEPLDIAEHAKRAGEAERRVAELEAELDEAMAAIAKES